MAFKASKVARVLILTANVGGGHLSIAKALEQIIIKDFPASQVFKINTTPKAGELLYRYIGNQFSTSFSAVWDWSNNKDRANILAQLQDFASHSYLKKYLQKIQPSLIISTEPFSIFTVQKIISESQVSIPHLVYVADPFNIHHIWATKPHATSYFCQTDEAKEKLHELGVSSKIINTIGFLVRSQFYQITTPTRSRKTTVLVGGSGEGGGNILSMVKKITKDKKLCKKIHLLVVCGKNPLLKTQVSLLSSLTNVTHKIISYTPQLHKYLAQSDFVVGKPGPNLLFESIMYLKPFIAIGDPLSQELGNYSFIDKERIGYSATNIQLAMDKIKLLVNDPSTLKELVSRLRTIREQHLHSQAHVRKILGNYL